jgi:L-iditol 2-dehydrogenase
MASSTGSSMWAMSLERPAGLVLTTAPAPVTGELRSGEVLLRTIGGAICGSDVPYFGGTVSPLFEDSGPFAAAVPGFPLHEIVGEVLHSDDPALPHGSTVVGWATETNAMAELTVTQAASLMTVPEWLSPLDALILQPLACVVDTLTRLGDLRDRHVGVIGLGPFGLLFSHVARSMGAGRVTGVDPVDRRRLADAFGLTTVMTATSDRWAANLRDDDRPDIIIEAVGHQVRTLNDAVAAVAPGGLVFAFGVPDEAVYPYPLQLAFRKSVTLAAGPVLERRASLRAADSYLREHTDLLTSYVTHTFAFSDAQEAFSMAARPRPDQIKIRFDAHLEGVPLTP